MNVKVIAVVLALFMVVGGAVLAESTQLNKNSDSSISENNETEKGQAEVSEDSSYVPDHAAERKEWSESGDEGPPPWAPDHARERWKWSQSGEEGPPPWVSDHAAERKEWSESGEEGPPPWANGRGNRNSNTGNGN